MKFNEGEIEMLYMDDNEHQIAISGTKNKTYFAVTLTVAEVNELIQELIKYTQENSEFGK